MRDCRYCAKPFQPRSTGGRVQAYCSAHCRLTDWAIKHGKLRARTAISEVPPNCAGGREMVCEGCGETFTTRVHAGGYRQRYCSSRCGQHSYYSEELHKLTNNVKQYGISAEDYLDLVAKQGGVCAICGRGPKNNRLSIDHDHNTGRVRGILCAPCNRHVGYFEAHGRAMLQYLSAPAKSQQRDEAAEQLALLPVVPPAGGAA